MGAVLQHSHGRSTIWDEHAAIAEAIAVGDGERAARLSEEHATIAREALVASLAQTLKATPPIAA
jgi:DNA-binding GntR family transcriptional regulator